MPSPLPRTPPRRARCDRCAIRAAARMALAHRRCAALVALAGWVGWPIRSSGRLATDLGIAAGESARRELPRVVAEKKPAPAPEPAAAESARHWARCQPEARAVDSDSDCRRRADAGEASGARTGSAVPPPAPSTLKPKALSATPGAPRVEKHELTPRPYSGRRPNSAEALLSCSKAA